MKIDTFFSEYATEALEDFTLNCNASLRELFEENMVRSTIIGLIG